MQSERRLRGLSVLARAQRSRCLDSVMCNATMAVLSGSAEYTIHQTFYGTHTHLSFLYNILFFKYSFSDEPCCSVFLLRLKPSMCRSVSDSVAL